MIPLGIILLVYVTPPSLPGGKPAGGPVYLPSVMAKAGQITEACLIAMAGPKHMPIHFKPYKLYISIHYWQETVYSDKLYPKNHNAVRGE